MASLYLDSRGNVGHNLRQAEPQPPSGQRPPVPPAMVRARERVSECERIAREREGGAREREKGERSGKSE